MLYTYTAGMCTKVCTGAGTGTGATSIPLPGTTVSSVRHQYRYREYRYSTKDTLAKY